MEIQFESFTPLSTLSKNLSNARQEIKNNKNYVIKQNRFDRGFDTTYLLLRYFQSHLSTKLPILVGGYLIHEFIIKPLKCNKKE